MRSCVLYCKIICYMIELGEIMSKNSWLLNMERMYEEDFKRDF